MQSYAEYHCPHRNWGLKPIDTIVLCHYLIDRSVARRSWRFHIRNKHWFRSLASLQQFLDSKETNTDFSRVSNWNKNHCSSEIEFMAKKLSNGPAVHLAAVEWIENLISHFSFVTLNYSFADLIFINSFSVRVFFRSLVAPMEKFRKHSAFRY